MAKEVKKIGLVISERIVEDLKQGVQDTEGCFFVGFNKVGAYPFNELRNNLRDLGAKVVVAKNSLFKRALSELGRENIDDLLETETAVVIIKDEDIVKVCKTLVEFTKETEALQLKGGFIRDKKVDSKELTSLAKLPSREVLIGMVVSSFASPMSGFLIALNQVILKFVWVIKEIKKTKEQKKG